MLRSGEDEVLLVVVNLGAEPVFEYGIELGREPPPGLPSEVLHRAVAPSPALAGVPYRPLDELPGKEAYVLHSDCALRLATKTIMNPDDLHPAERRRQRLQRDVAFAAFLYIGWLLASAFVLRWIPATLPGYWHFGSFLAYPALVLAVPAALAGLSYTVVVRRERALWLLAALVVAVGPVLYAIRALAWVRGPVAGAFFSVLTIAALALPLAWFLRCRRRWSRLSEAEARTELERGW